MKIRLATPADAPDMVHLINEIIAIGGSTAYETPFDDEKMRDTYIAPTSLISCHAAEQDGVVKGFQRLTWPDIGDDLPVQGWAVIASFVAGDAAGHGIGQHLFAATRNAANQAGVKTIDATIRADNVAGLRYYSGLGFVDYDRLVGIPLQDGTPVDRIRKRLDLQE